MLLYHALPRLLLIPIVAFSCPQEVHCSAKGDKLAHFLNQCLGQCLNFNGEICCSDRKTF